MPSNFRDLEIMDAVGIMLIAIWGPMAIGFWNLTINAFNFDFSTVIWSAQGVSITYSTLIALLGVAWIGAVNFWLGDWTLDNFTPWGATTLLVGLSIIPIYAFVPAVQTTFSDFGAVSAIFALTQIGMGPLLSWEGL